ncbi:2,3-diphosphoglycerate-dependent phosphoglycerate mutase [Candidatus Palibaumannia cicadellinicola]|uniref:2,3-bisphosphoglycerate-dependent phosphoglycerate mutase n=1 Tax=Baumannia cicadellinicola subsp. Homalodisca coagulata TaxID=374463 RepID=GPMA_BAUCH|nr:2,3-diphosphoglycerate-dependent phosphoglycerate mutase [Candidatus Baumannia cicadellinicola]Q1LTL3.1 RecName: Full=2,3-bisphosphoglycerate-dependent phosphoglycerate mutase; Short=BPG-dependent PGAM; Short=PGAM; Short=Phosphoglyceromutase; Short=dPGM [Baumannia cicadellinicola str. Hc (Homalodisca coagulata)]ABF13818.1 phosphoglycerate mutase [Baumannia cicadellinicola str. Hc (Homalodisca coagulata)]MCJ7462316.1 2,3-diphosphoglycerate-dependent phosphoglycerate mutase [Candidatus Baumanni
MTLNKLVLIRHGESKWNNENRFTGWTDIDLSDQGRIEAKNAGQLLKQAGFIFDFAYTSVLKRAIHTLWYILDELDQAWLPVEKSWRLNERHYGALQGLNKKKITVEYGEEQVQQWRRSLNITPPELSDNDKRLPIYDIRYAKLSLDQLPKAESLAMTINRIIPYWKGEILPRINNGERVIIAAHGNSIRAIITLLDQLSENELIQLNIPTGVPIIYEFNSQIKTIKHYYLSIVNKDY